MRTLLVALLSSSAQVISAAEFYRWVDDQGVTHYSARPPQNKEASVVRTSNLNPSSTSTDAEEKPEVDSENLEETSPVAQLTPEQVKVKQENCAISKRNLKTIQENNRVRILENGEYRYLTEEEKQARLKGAQDDINEFCN